MRIPVVLKNGETKVVSNDDLQFMIVNHQVLVFKRSDGWAVIGRDQMREYDSHMIENERRMHDFFAIDH